MRIEENFAIKDYNTFGISAFARYFVEIDNENDIFEYLDLIGGRKRMEMVLGGGSNMLFTKDFDGYLLKNNLKGITLLKETEEHYFVKAAAGENWHSFVKYCIENNYAGVENLSLIPGNVGASPIQNIGAYGVEAKDTIYEVEAVHLKDKKKMIFSNEECDFSYRDSIFKNKEKGNYMITAVIFKLNKKPDFKTDYGDIKRELELMQVDTLSLKAVSAAICKIRESKLPDFKKIGNCGSFFKNPVVPKEKAVLLKNKYSEMPVFAVSENESKIPAGWLIEQCGWKGKKVGNCGVHDKQALVLINLGNATGQEVFQLSEDILTSVKNKFDVALEREVNIMD